MIDKWVLQQLVNRSHTDKELLSLARYSFYYLHLNLTYNVNNDVLLKTLFEKAEQDKEEYLTDLFSFLDMDIGNNTALIKDIKEIINNIKIKLCFLIVLDNLLVIFAKNAYAGSGLAGSDSTPILSSADRIVNTISSVHFMLLANNQKYLVVVDQIYSSSKNRTDISKLKDMTVHVALYKYNSSANPSPALEDYCSLGDLKQRIEHNINFGRFE